jgi:hypothetical protein
MAGKSSKAEPPSAALRAAIQSSGASMYRLAKDTGLAYATVWRFVAAERSLSQDASDRLCLHLGLRLVKEKDDSR